MIFPAATSTTWSSFSCRCRKPDGAEFLSAARKGGHSGRQECLPHHSDFLLAGDLKRAAWIAAATACDAAECRPPRYSSFPGRCGGRLAGCRPCWRRGNFAAEASNGRSGSTNSISSPSSANSEINCGSRSKRLFGGNLLAVVVAHRTADPLKHLFATSRRRRQRGSRHSDDITACWSGETAAERR